MDPRVRKTRRAIRNAFAQLLAEKDVNDITVKEISEIAEINRKTFYNHYPGIYKVVDEIEDDLVTALDAILGEVDFRKDMKKPERVLRFIADIVNRDPLFYGNLLAMNGKSSLGAKIVQLLKEKTKQTLMSQINIDQITADIVLEYSISGLVSVYKLWIKNPQSQIPEEVANILSTLFFNGFCGIMADFEEEALEA